MFLICLLLIVLIAITELAVGIAMVTDTEPSTAKQAEFIPITVRLAKADSLRKFG